MLNYIRKKLGKTLYVQVWEHCVKVTDVASQEIYEIEPLVAIETRSNGNKIVSGIGDQAILNKSSNIQIVNPFSHPRALLSDFHTGEKVLQYVFRELLKGTAISPSPRVVMHPMEKTEGGLTMIEERAFKELALGAGASEVYIKQGPVLSLNSFDIDRLFAGTNTQLNTPGFLKTVFYVALFALVILYVKNN